MNVTLFAAMSVNGFIAREDGREDFLSDENWRAFSAHATDAGCVIMGRKTYDAILTWDGIGFKDINDVQKIILTHQKDLLPQTEKTVFVTSPKEAIEKAAELGFSKAVLAGGSTLNTSFAKEGMIDEVIVNLEPTLVGKGIPVFQPDIFEMELELVSIEKLSDSIVMVRYRVV